MTAIKYKTGNGYVSIPLNVVQNDVVQTTGQSTTAVMSQKAVTDALQSINFTGTIIVVLEEYINNSKTVGSGLVGAVITLTNTSDSETVGTHTIVSGETGYTFSDLTPMKNYSISVSALSGYTQPEAQTVSELGIGVSVTKTFQYQADEYTIAITSDQGASDPAISEAVVTINSTDYENGDTIKFATGTSQSDIEALCTATDVARYDVGVTVNTTNKTITAAYEEQRGIDLGLPSGILWAPQNVGAENPEDAGLYFSWGNVDGHAAGSGYIFSDANYQLTDGYTLTGDIPQSADFDAAMANMGAPWMMPSTDLFAELNTNTDQEWATINGVNGRKFMKKSDHSVFIFMPAGGEMYGSTFSNKGNNGRFWSNVLYDSTHPYYMNFYSSNVNPQANGFFRYYGMSVRAVRYPNICKIHLTSTDNSSVSGVKIKVSNSSVTLNVATDSNGDAIFSLPNGTFSIESSTHVLSIMTMAVSGNTTVNANSTYIIGNWIFERKGGLYDATQWAAAKQAGTVSDDDVIGIVVNTEEHKLMISLESLGTLSAYLSATSPAGMTAINTQSAAEADFNGEANTLLMMNTYGTDSTYAAGACRNYMFANGSKGYLPASGEFKLAYTNKSIVDALITACGATAMDTSNYCSTSTYYGRNSSYVFFWSLSWNDGSMTTSQVQHTNCIRPFTQWKPISTKLHFTATDESSVANMVLEITDGSGNSIYVKTGADGDCYLSLDSGTYTITSLSHSLSIGTFTITNANVITTVNISATKMEYVDLGLPSGVKWATCNLGASSPTEGGDYFSWGNIVGHAEGSGYSFNQTTYNSTPGASLSANISSSDATHDAALAIKGSPWRMPTKAEYEELISGCTYTWVTIDGVNGGLFKSNVSGYTDKKIFIPVSGYYNGTSLATPNVGQYNSSMYNTSASSFTHRLRFDSSQVQLKSDLEKYCGTPIRPVQ